MLVFKIEIIVARKEHTKKMGQYYYPIILDKEGKIVVWMCAHRYGNGAKLTEHSYMGNNFVQTFEFGLSPEGAQHKSRVVWAGDYADPDPDQEHNLYRQCTEYNEIHPTEKDTCSKSARGERRNTSVD